MSTANLLYIPHIIIIIIITAGPWNSAIHPSIVTLAYRRVSTYMATASCRGCHHQFIYTLIQPCDMVMVINLKLSCWLVTISSWLVTIS